MTDFDRTLLCHRGQGGDQGGGEGDRAGDIAEHGGFSGA
jgi:hypothetical protein